MRNVLAALCLFASAFAAEAQQFPVVPDQTVIGRIGNPTFDSGSGPSQAIPFASLFAAGQIGQLGGHLVAGQFPTVPGIITGAMFANAGATTLFGNPTTSAGAPSFFTLASLPIKNSPATTDLVVISDLAASGVFKQVPIAAIGTIGSVASINGVTGAILGVNTNTLSTQTLPFTITNSNTPCGTTINVVGGPGTLTLSGVSGFNSACVIQVCNTAANSNTTHAFALSGFPVGSLPHLWMQQCEEVSIVNGAWAATKLPGRFKPSFNPPTIFVDSTGASTNDGLVSNASGNAVALASQCISILQVEFDLSNNIIPICSFTAGQVFNEAALIYPRGGNGNGVIYFLGNGGTATLRTSGKVVLELYDFAGYIIFGNMQLDCTGAGSPCWGLFLHQQTGVDLSSAAPAAGQVQFVGTASTSIAVVTDGQAKINSANAPLLHGTFGTGFLIDQNSVLDLNQGLTVDNSATIAGNLIQLTHGSSLLWSGLLTLGTSNSVAQILYANSNSAANFATFTLSGSIGGGGRQWAVANNSILCNASAVAIPGSAGISSGFSPVSAPGIIVNGGVSGGCNP